MLVEEIIGKTITDIYCTSRIEQGWVDAVECFIELDNEIVIDIPYPLEGREEVWIKELKADAASIFEYLPEYQSGNTMQLLNKNVKNSKPAKSNFLVEFFKRLSSNKEWEARLRALKDKKIVDFIWYENDALDKGLIMLENGYLITEILMSPNGTGRAGLNSFTSIEELIGRYGKDFQKLSDQV